MKVTIAKSAYTDIENIVDKRVFEDAVSVKWVDKLYVIVKQKNGATAIPHSEVGRIIIENIETPRG